MTDDGGLPVLDPVEQRVLGSLLEKERTVPASYPMTLNGLRTACNQSSSRDPVVDYDDATIVAALDELKTRGLARMVYASHGSRTAPAPASGRHPTGVSATAGGCPVAVARLAARPSRADWSSPGPWAQIPLAAAEEESTRTT